ncbi:hypothetical protein lerEdw1_015157 [Lerista edwardsae]|nr:hypothetical protein lerEdw1_015159 [Lerista edwardsae]KAJ6613909.1 hypothetical protein lerEdw1_015157 [Lerista edwardsae]
MLRGLRAARREWIGTLAPRGRAANSSSSSSAWAVRGLTGNCSRGGSPGVGVSMRSGWAGGDGLGPCCGVRMGPGRARVPPWSSGADQQPCLVPPNLAAADSPPSLLPAEHFVYQSMSECGFPNGTGPGVHYLDRYFWGRQEYLRFDSRRGSYEPVTELGKPTARKWNSDKAFLERKQTAVDWFCRHNYGIYKPFTAARKLKPQLKITPTDADPSSPHHTLLVCTVARFFPAKINVTWLWNGQEEDEGRVVSTGLIRNGDWTFSMKVMLEVQPERGDVYACRVEHASLLEPSSVQWVPQSDSARSKMWTGVVGLLLGLAFAVPGLALYLKSKTGDGGSGGRVCWGRRE